MDSGNKIARKVMPVENTIRKIFTRSLIEEAPFRISDFKKAYFIPDE